MNPGKTMSELLVFDPAMCCSTGVCGPEVDPALVRFAADLASVSRAGVTVRRFNLGSEPQAFMRNALVRETIQREGTACLPLVMAGGEVVSRGRYPSREELAGWAAQVPAAPSGAGAPALIGIGQPAGGCAPGSGCC
jgi:arsenite methyltransferase